MSGAARPPGRDPKTEAQRPAAEVDLPEEEGPAPGWRGFLASLGLGELVIGSMAASLLAFAAWELGWMQPDPDLAAPAYHARIGAEEAPLRLAAEVTPAEGLLTLELLAGQAAPGRALHLWWVSADGAPLSLLVWPEGAARQDLPLSPALATRLEGAVLAVTDEPAGGAPEGRPTGAVLATGALRRAE
ncbi:anti-sigma factor domain-containing protein [Pseudooceanicola sp. 200-1SW]|uniref:anti-sigma factor domain-containing protein n=1 Tax=Pseudooceanicola sp. 200-1SW TaxID=3425949 RepID=UPI003D7FFBA0